MEFSLLNRSIKENPLFFSGDLMENLNINSNMEPDEQLQSMQEQMDCVERLIQSCAVPTFVIDSRHRVILWNRACEALTGVNAAEVIGTNDLGKVFYGYERPVLADFVIDDNLMGVQNKYDVHAHSLLIPDGLQAERWYTDKNGKERYIFFDAAPIRNNQGETIAAIETLQDITARKRAEEKLQRIAANLRESNDDIRSFAYIISHDLRAPLVNLKGFSCEMNLALQELAPIFESGVSQLGDDERRKMEALFRKELPEALEFIDSSANRMDRLINAILKLSRLGVQKLKPIQVDTANLAHTIIKSLAHQLEQRHATVHLGVLPKVLADATAMEQIMANLLENAVKYLAPDRPGRIEIEAETSADMTTFHVRDNGRGIDSADLERVFEIFRRSGRQNVPGEGVGLAYVKTLVRRHGGRIWCVSHPGEGSTFSFTIPLTPEEESGE
jgi:PAS domain S-box-containing protein